MEQHPLTEVRRFLIHLVSLYLNKHSYATVGEFNIKSGQEISTEH